MTESDRDDAPPPAADSPPATEQDAEADDGEAERGKHSMTLLEHLRELRSRLVRCLIAVGVGFLVCYGFVDILYAALIRPLETSMLPNSHMIFTVLYGPFFVQLKIALLAGLMLASPYVFYQIWAFSAPGLYHEERRHIVPLAAVSALFFIAGAACCYLGVLPFAFGFFLSYSTDFVVAQPDIVDYFDFVLKLILAFGLIFEMPLFTLFLT
ncbi:MAG: twin-arginine translocase subunit TatC, partial [Deltaproteobacteria bacterium]|nr:twin-arginine translocase subunit TatC [Deltaproteobacteria bacterium]